MRTTHGRRGTRLLAVASGLLIVAAAGCDTNVETPDEAGPPPERIHCDDGLWDDLDLRKVLDLPTQQVEINNTLPGPTVVGLCSVRLEGEAILRLRIEPSDEEHAADFVERFGALGLDLGNLDAFVYNHRPDDVDEPLVVYGVARTPNIEDGDPRPYIIDLTFHPAEDRDPIEDAHQLAEGVIDYIESYLERREQRRT